MDILKQTQIFKEVEDAHLHSLKSKMKRSSFHRGEVIFHQGDPADRMHIIETGRVKISIISIDGQEKDMALLHPGDCFGEMALLDTSTRSATATSLDESQTISLLQNDLLGFLEDHPEVAAKINGLLIQRLRNANEMVGDIVFLDVPTRVAKQLTSLAEALVDDPSYTGDITIPMGQEEIARLVGASREAVSRSLSSYRNMGILTTANRRIIISDLYHLKHIASF